MTAFVLIVFFAAALVVGTRVLISYRTGLLLLIFFLPFSASQLIPRQVLVVPGLNPVNLLFLLTVASYVAATIVRRERLVLPRSPGLGWLMLLPFTIGAILGLMSAGETPYSLIQLISPETDLSSTQGYGLAFVVKPILLVAAAYLVAIGVARGLPQERAVIPAFCSMGVLSTVVVAYIASSGLDLAALADTSGRATLSWTGMHANELGLLLNTGLSMSLFSASKTRKADFAVRLYALSALLACAVILTFSRGAMLGLVCVAAAFLHQSRSASKFSFALLVLGAVLIFAPEEVFNRALHGVAERDTSSISAGRLDDIWKPMLPRILDSPIWGGGLSSIMWSPQMKSGQVLPVGHPHNAYLGLLLDVGVAGTLLVLGFWLYAWKLFRREAKSATSELGSGFFEGASVAIIILCVQGFTDDRFTPTYSQAYLWIAFGLALGAKHCRRPLSAHELAHVDSRHLTSRGASVK